MSDLTERAAEEQLYAERERYRTLIDQIEIGIFHSDADDRLVFVNDEYLRTMGCSPADLAGTGWHSRVHPDDHDRVTQQAASAGRARRNWSDQYRVVPAPGVVRWVRSSARPLHDQDGAFAGYLGTCLDITELREAEEDRRRAAVAQAARQISEAVAARLQALVTGLSAIVWERDASSGEYTFITDRVVDVLGYSINAWIGRSDFWPSILHPADRDDAVATAAAATAAGRDWEQTYRAVSADGRTVWLHDLVHVVRDDTGAAASVLGVSIDVTTQRRQDEAMALLVEFGSLQDGDQALDERLTALIQAATPGLAEMSAVVLVGPDNLLRPFAAAAPEHPDALTAVLAAAPLPVPPSVAERLAAGRAFVLPGSSAEIVRQVVADDDELPARMAVGARDWLIVPLTAAGRMLGLLAFASLTRPRTYDALDMTLAEEFAHRIALMIQADEAARRERHLRDMSAALASADTPAAVGQVLRNGLADAFGASGLTIHAVEHPTDVLRLVTTTGYPPGLVERFRVVRLSDPSPIARCARTGKPVWLGDFDGWQADDEEHVARAALALPLRTGARLVGVVAASFPTHRAFSQDERDGITTMVGQAAQAFHRAVEAEQRRDIAETLQHSLLPAEPPRLERLALATQYLPGVSGVEAGGDWFDVVTLDENRTAIVVGDVVGQGATAAALMGQLRSALSSGLLLVESPAAALAHLNRFTARIPGARASTAVCLVIDTATGQACWARAGHPPPLLVPREGPARHVDGGAGPLLGVYRDDDPVAGVFTEAALTITPGDTLVLYTDGLVERRGESIDDGMDRLTGAASSLTAVDPPRLVAGLLAATVPAGRGHDDIAVVAARLLPPPLHLRCPARPEELSAVRRAAHEWLAAHGFPDALSEDLQLALGEAAANAAEHAYPADDPGEFEFRLRRHVDGSAIDVEVTDFGRWRPPLADPGFRGRGLDLIHILARSVSVEHGPGGTTVRFTVPCPAPDPRP